MIGVSELGEPTREPNDRSSIDSARDVLAWLEGIVPDMLDFLRNPPPSPYPPVTYDRSAYVEFDYASFPVDAAEDDIESGADPDEVDRNWVRFLIRLVQHFGPRSTGFAHHYYPDDDPDGVGAQAAAATGGAYEDTPHWTQGRGESSRVLDYLTGLEPSVPLSFPFYSLLLYDTDAARAIVDISGGAARIGVYDIRDGDEAFLRDVAPPGLDIEIYTYPSARPR